jgi:hypothetical protein
MNTTYAVCVVVAALAVVASLMRGGRLVAATERR